MPGIFKHSKVPKRKTNGQDNQSSRAKRKNRPGARGASDGTTGSANAPAPQPRVRVQPARAELETMLAGESRMELQVNNTHSDNPNHVSQLLSNGSYTPSNDNGAPLPPSASESRPSSTLAMSLVAPPSSPCAQSTSPVTSPASPVEPPTTAAAQPKPLGRPLTPPAIVPAHQAIPLLSVAEPMPPAAVPVPPIAIAQYAPLGQVIAPLEPMLHSLAPMPTLAELEVLFQGEGVIELQVISADAVDPNEVQICFEGQGGLVLPSIAQLEHMFDGNGDGDVELEVINPNEDSGDIPE